MMSILSWMRIAYRYPIAIVVSGCLMGVSNLIAHCSGDIKIISNVATSSYVFVLLIGLLHGLRKLLVTHPVFSPGYTDFLAASPWRAGSRLPIAQPFVQLADVLALFCYAGIAVLLWSLIQHDNSVRPAWSYVAPLLSFGIPYVFLCLLMCVYLGMTGAFYSLSFICVLMIHLAKNPDAVVIVLAGAVLWSQYVVRRALQCFPWPEFFENGGWSCDLNVLTGLSPAEKQTGACWAVMSPAKIHTGIRWENRILGPALSGVLAFMLVSAMPPKASLVRPADWVEVLMIVWVLLGAMRLARYVYGYRTNFAPPHDIFGRTATGRLFISGYDQIWLPCVLSIGTAWMSFKISNGLNMGLSMAVTLSVTLSLFVLLNCGPSMERWRLKGAYRFDPNSGPGRRRGQNQLLIQSSYGPAYDPEDT